MKTEPEDKASAPPPPAPTRTEPRKGLKSIKHTYSKEERQNLGEEMARQVNDLRATESEFEQVKAQYKSRTALAEAIMHKCAAALTSGFEFREVPHVLYLDIKRRRRVWFPQEAEDSGMLKNVARWSALEWDAAAAKYGVVEEMRPDDFQAELPIAQKGGDK
jgi:hypothetical protein